MSSEGIQNSIIRKVLDSKDDALLNYLNQLLSEAGESEQYILSSSEEKLISESIADYKTGKVVSNEDVTLRNGKWLRE
ncbi:MAG: hypothetical protein NTZ69_08075 [Bacteroidia bacterium]|nr:hypothetical protein [Bacteroidia bacterium]